MSNRLAAETSPYLRQHAGNPVCWHPWGEEALALARSQDKPILLSIGYSACHWCHVMAHESFEDPATAAVMNALFVNIKVDREERPDLDQIYQHAHALLSGQGGGWPLTVFLTPEQVPFFSGTYFPPRASHGLPAFADLLRLIAEAWRTRRADIAAQDGALRDALRRSLRQDAPAPPDGAVIAQAQAQLARQFDPQHGGFGGAPKFPNPGILELLLAGADGARHMALLTLQRMAAGGIYDHVGGGFYRYSVDDHWEIPHFEKMLCDNGQLLALYADAWQLTQEPRYAALLEETTDWALAEMCLPEGGFCASLDADSDGGEGRYYVWQRGELAARLDADGYALLQLGYGLDQEANFGQAWHLRQTRPPATLAAALGLAPAELQARWQRVRGTLRVLRAQRIPPGRDDKLLTGWNALMVRGLARAGRVLERRDWVAAAQRAADCLRRTLWQHGRLFATCTGGRARLNAYLDDHAFVLDALLELLQAEFRAADLAWAGEVADALLARFEDAAAGGFFFTSHDHEALLERPKPLHDHATPAGNGVAARALLRLGRLLNEPRYLRAAERTLTAFAGSLARSPAACPAMLGALQDSLLPPPQVLLTGPAAELAVWRRRLARCGVPGLMVLVLPPDTRGLPASLQRPHANRVNAWLCRGVECLPAIDEVERLLDALQPLGKRT